MAQSPGAVPTPQVHLAVTCLHHVRIESSQLIRQGIKPESSAGGFPWREDLRVAGSQPSRWCHGAGRGKTGGLFLWGSHPKHRHSPLCQVIVVQSLNCVRLFATPQTAACQASLFFTISRGLLKLMSIESVMPSNHLILSHPFSSCLQPFPASGSFPVNWLFTSGAKVLNLQLHHQSFQ